jgi:hypothetical protein
LQDIGTAFPSYDIRVCKVISYCQIQSFDHLYLPANIHEGTFRKLCHIDRQFYIYVDIAFEKIKYLGDIQRKYKLKGLNLCPECVTRNDILKEGLQELHFTEEWHE